MAYENMNQFVEYLRAIQVKADNDLFIGCTGPKGAGKSSFSIQIARRYCEKYFGEKTFDLNKYIAYNNDQVVEKIHTLPMYSPLIGDEAVRFAWSRDWNKSENRELARLSVQIRTKKLIFFMNIPKIGMIDSVYREGMLDIWVWIHANFDEGGKKEGHALIFEPDNNQGEIDSWHLAVLKKHAKKPKNRVARFTPIEKLHKMVKHHPCFVDVFKFPKLPQDIYDRYMAIRSQNVFDQEGKFVSQKDTSKIILYNLKENWEKLKLAVETGKQHKLTFKDIYDILLVDPRTNHNILTQKTVTTWFNDIKKTLPVEIRDGEVVDKEVEEQVSPPVMKGVSDI